MDRLKKDSRIHISTARLTVISVVIALVVLDISFVYAWGIKMKNIEEESSTDVFTEYQTETLFGEKFTSQDAAKAKLTAYNVWETTCPACLGEMGALEELSHKYPPEEFQLVGVCADLFDKYGELKQGQLKKAQSLMNDAGTTFPHIIPTQDMSRFFDSVIPGYPTTFFVDQNGKIVDSTSGSNDLEGWTRKVDEVLGKME